MKKTYSILGAIAIVVIIVYNLLPDVFFEEFVFPEDKIIVMDYDDSTDGGESIVHTHISDSLIAFDCALGVDTTKAAWCGLLWNMDPDSLKAFKNWTFVDTLIFDIEVSGTREILVKLWAFDPDVTDVKKSKTYRLLMKEMPLKEGRQRVVIPMEHLYTPDFWYQDVKADKNSNRRYQESIARLEIAPGWNQARGKKFNLKIYSVVAKGVSSFNFGIVLAIFLVLTVIAIGLRHQTKYDDEKK